MKCIAALVLIGFSGAVAASDRAFPSDCTQEITRASATWGKAFCEMCKAKPAKTCAVSDMCAANPAKTDFMAALSSNPTLLGGGKESYDSEAKAGAVFDSGCPAPKTDPATTGLLGYPKEGAVVTKRQMATLKTAKGWEKFVNETGVVVGVAKKAPPTSGAAKKVSGTFKLKVPAANASTLEIETAFADAKVKTALQTAIADQITGVGKEMVTILEVTRARRLATATEHYTINVKYEITLPKGSSVTPASVVKAMTGASAKTSLATLVNKELKKLGFSVTITVGETTAAEKVTPPKVPAANASTSEVPTVPKKVSGTFKLKVPAANASTFKTDAKVKIALQTAIADQITGVEKEMVTILEVTSARRLATATEHTTINVKYEITLPKGSSVIPASVVKAMTGASAKSSLATLVNKELKKQGVIVTITVEETTAAEKVTPPKGSTNGAAQTSLAFLLIWAFTAAL